ncbi:MAG: FMN-binding protein [Clostridiales bacterium]|nr:FMN-binding protein [Clostridiales bacterium]
MKNKNVRGILALAVVTALSFGVIIGSKALAVSTEGGNTSAAEDKVLEELDTNGAENIEKAVKTESGYVVTVKTKGYGGDVVMNVSFDKEGKKVTKAEVVQQNETEGLGAKIAEPEFLSQFEGVEAPVYLPGMSLEEEEKETEAAEKLTLNDGTYEAKTPEPDQNGFTEQVTMTVKDGKVTEVNWDAVTADGTKKSVMSENGEYTMTEDGLTWAAQAEALAAALIENQSLGFLNMDEQGKTDAVSGVSISVGGFVNLAEKCLNEAAGVVEEEAPAPENGTQVDGVSGATVSSTAAVKAVNSAFDFLQTVK